MDAIAIISIFVLAVFVGFEVVSKVSSTLHTPLMSGANAIHGVILVGAIIVADHSETNLELGLSLAAIVLATINMVGGQANIPISVHNGLLQPVTVVVNADPNNARLIVKGSEKVTIQPESQTKAQIPVQAQVSNGSSVLTVSLQSLDGVAIGEPVSIPINVRADWETWGLGAVALAFVGLLTAGVIRTLRRRRTGSADAA